MNRKSPYHYDQSRLTSKEARVQVDRLKEGIEKELRLLALDLRDQGMAPSSIGPVRVCGHLYGFA